MRQATRPTRPPSGYAVSTVFLVIFALFLVALFLGLAAIRNALFTRASTNVIKDSDSPPNLIGKPIDYGICEEPRILCKDPGRGTDPDAAAGMWALVGVRPDRFVTRNAVYYTDEGCAGDVYLAPPAAPLPLGNLLPELPVGYLDGLETVGQMSPLSYGVGAPEGFLFGPPQTPTGPGLLYRSADAAITTPTISSVWTSLAPDCVLEPLPAGVAAGDIECPQAGDPGTVASQAKISATSGLFPGGLLDPADRFGGGLAGLGDLDGDGVTDLAITARFDDDGAPGNNQRGAVYITFMNADGTVKGVQKISDIAGGFTGVLDNGDSFGRSVVSLGNLAGLAGVVEIAVGARNDDDGGTDRGAVWILSLDAGGMVVAFQKISTTQGGFGAGLQNSDLFGVSVEDIGDLDGNGVPDLAVGAPRDDAPGVDRGAVWIVFLNADGTVSAKAQINHPDGGLTLGNDDRFGTSIAFLGDLSGDGTIELAVGAGNDDDGGANRGAVWIVSVNSAGSATSVQKISDTAGSFTGVLDDGDEFGNAVAGLADLDGDTVRDLAVGARLDDDGGSNRGALWILFLETDGTVKGFQKISSTMGGFAGGLDNGDFFGAEIASVGDFDGDGIGDLAVNAILDDDGGADIGAVYLLLLNGVSTPASCVGPPEDLVSWWPGDGNPDDIADGNGATLLNGATFGAGRVGQGFFFDGVDDQVRVPGADNLRQLTSLTIDAWIRAEGANDPVDPPVGDVDVIVRLDNLQTLNVGPRAFYVMDLVNGRPRLGFRGGGSASSTVATCVACPDLRDSTFHHLAVVRDETANRARMYLDGTEVLNVPDPAVGDFDTVDPAILVLGRYDTPRPPAPPVARRLYRGIIDEVEIFDRALTECEIQQIFLAGPFGKCKAGEEVFPEDLCTNIAPRSLALIRAEEVVVDPSSPGSANLLEGPPYVTPFNIMPAMVGEVPAEDETAGAAVDYTVPASDEEN